MLGLDNPSYDFLPTTTTSALKYTSSQAYAESECHASALSSSACILHQHRVTRGLFPVPILCNHGLSPSIFPEPTLMTELKHLPSRQ
jgi:hypothetical protein